MEDLKKLITLFILEELWESDETFSEDLPLISGGYIDSLAMVSLKEFLEKRLGISIPDEQATAEAFDSVDKIAKLLNRFIN